MFLQNKDVKVAVSIVTKATVLNPSVPVNLSLLNDYQFYLYHLSEGQPKLLFIYKKNGSGLNAITPDGIITNKARIIISRAITRNIPANELYLEVETQATATSEYLNSLANSGAAGIALFPLVASSNPKNGIQ